MKIENPDMWRRVLDTYAVALNEGLEMPNENPGLIEARINHTYDLAERIRIGDREFTDKGDLTVLCAAANDYVLANMYWNTGIDEIADYMLDRRDEIREEINK